MNDIAYVTCK